MCTLRKFTRVDAAWYELVETMGEYLVDRARLKLWQGLASYAIVISIKAVRVSRSFRFEHALSLSLSGEIAAIV